MRITRERRRGAGWRRVVATVAIAASLAGPVAAQPRTSPRPAAASPTAELVQAERDLLAAMTSRNAAALDRLLAPQFALVSAFSEGEVIPRADWIAGLLDRRGTDAGTVTSPEVRVHAPGVATVVARIAWSTADGGPTPQREEYLVTDTWVRRGRIWMLAARHSSVRRSVP